MRRTVKLYLFLLIFISKAYAAGFDIKTSSVIDQPGVEVLGNNNGSWYLIGFEKPGRLREPARFKILKYASGFGSAKTSSIYPSFGEKSVYLGTAFVNDKISMFYGKCERRAETEALNDTREGHKIIPSIMCQDYDLNSLAPMGKAKPVFKSDAEGFAASGISIAESDDKSKTAILVKCYYKEQKCKIFLTDNNRGQIYAKTFDLKLLKEQLSIEELMLSNDGAILIKAKTRDDAISIYQNGKDIAQAAYYFFSIDKNGNEPKCLIMSSATEKEKCTAEPVMSLLNNGEIVLACNFSRQGKGAPVNGISISKYSINFKLIAKKEIVPDANLLSQSATYRDSKKENGLSQLETQQLLPLDGGNFMLIAMYRRLGRNKEKSGKKIAKNYFVTYRINEKLALSGLHLIAKEQAGTSPDNAFSLQAYRKGNDVFLFHNDNRNHQDEEGTNLQCTRLPANGAEPETQKIIHTSADFYTSMKHLYGAGNGKLLFTEEKPVDYENVSREVKLLEITMK